MKENRRTFLKKSFAGITGAALLNVTGKSKPFQEAPQNTRNKIVKRVLGRTGIQVPVISMGATSNDSILRAAYEMGARYFDTANRYGAGRHEQLLGKVLKGKDRKTLIVATKIIPMLDNEKGLPPKTVSPSDFKKDFQQKMLESLKRLQMDYVDILYLHGVETESTLKNSLIKEVMLELKEKKLARFIGVSFHHKELELIRATADEGIYDMLLTSYNFRQPHRDSVRKELAYAASKGLGTVAMKVMAGAYWDNQKKMPINPKASLKWCLQDPNIHTLIPKIDTFEQLEINLSVMEDLNLSEREKRDLRFGDGNPVTGLYCSQCGTCRTRCRYGLEIPTVMRSYMYAFGYGEPLSARNTLDEKQKTAITCRNCTDCAVTCTMGFDVKNKMREILPLTEVNKSFLV